MINVKYPLILLNFKVYLETAGEKGLEKAQIAEVVSKETGVSIAIAPHLTDLALIASRVEIPVFSQTAFANGPGSFTGSIPLTSIKESGASGVILNHSERPLLFPELDNMIKTAKDLDLHVVTCAHDARSSGAIARLDPHVVAFEPPELIGSGRSVSTTAPETVIDAVKEITLANSRVIPLCGAGISTAEDVKKALELGTQGVLVASAFAKAKNPQKVLEEMATAVIQHEEMK